MHANLYLQAGMGSTVSLLAVSLLKRTVGSFSSILVISNAGIEATIFHIRYSCLLIL